MCNIHSFFVNGFKNNAMKLKDGRELDNSAIHARTHDSITTRKASRIISVQSIGLLNENR